MKTILILDSHALIHRAYHALPEFYNKDGFPTGALYGVVSTILSVLKEFEPEYVFAAFDLPKPTYRHELYKQYKAKRPKMEKDLSLQISKVKEIFKNFGFILYEKPGYEADDIIATLAKMLKSKNEFKDYKIVIVSGDMDTMQMVDDRKVMVYTFKRSLKDTILYDEKSVKERFGFEPKYIPDFKGLKGDPSDNIVGVKGIGDKTATELIKTFGTIDNIYKAIDSNDKKLSKFKERIINLLKEGRDDAYFSKMLATTKDDVDIDFDNKNIVKWRDNFDYEKIIKIFDKLDFRSLKTRLKDLFSDKKETKTNVDLDEILFKRTAVLLYLLDSNKTEPKPDDIFSYTNKSNLLDSYYYLFKKVEDENLKYVYEEIENPLIPVIDKINQTGILIDVDYFKKLESQVNKELSKLERKMFDIVGERFNPRSPKQLSHILYEKLKIKQSKKTKSGQLKTDEKTLKSLKDDHEIIPIILKYRELHKLYSTYIEAILRQVSKDKRIRTTFIQTGTTTGRLSSKNPNLQNIPTQDTLVNIRKGFIASSNKKLLSLDYSQIELKIAAILSKDKDLIDIFNKGKDIHRAVAAKIFHVDEKDVTDKMRRHAKVVNFGILYGMGARSLKDSLGDEFSLDDAKKYLETYFDTFKGLAKWIDDTIQETKKLGYAKTIFGRKRYFKEINSKIEYIAKQAERMAVNFPIQGTQADMIKMAMWKIDEMILENRLQKKVRIILQIHDEIILEVSDDVVESVCLSTKKIMESVLPDKYQLIKITADAKYGDNWGEMSKIVC